MRRIALAEYDPAIEHDASWWSDACRFALSTTIAQVKGSRSSMPYPISVTLKAKMGTDPNAFIAYDMTWEEVRQLHQQLDRSLKDRKRFEAALKRAKERQR